MESVEAFLDRVRQAWDAGDSDAFAREFAEDATYVIFRGHVLLGREEIRSTHAEIFSKWLKDTRMRVKLLHIHHLSEAAVCIVTIGGVGKDSHIPYDKFQTLTLIRNGQDTWQYIAFQNTEMSSQARLLYNPDQSNL
jgi:uncharacterized protein (TIGR02246 family)